MRRSIVVVSFLAVFCLCSVLWALDPNDPALVGLWLCDEGSGDTLVDSSGNGNDATGQFEWDEGRFGNGIVVSAGSIIVPTSDSVNSIGEALTVAAWFRVDADSDTGIRRQNAFLLEDQSTSEPVPKGFSFRIWTATDPSPGIYGRTELELGVWYHIAGTYDGEMMRLYIDGVEEEDPMDSVGGDVDGKWSGDIQAPGDQLQLKYGSETYIGAMDEIVIFSRALSAEEIGLLAQGWEKALAGAVDYHGKLSITWGGIKSLHQ